MDGSLLRLFCPNEVTLMVPIVSKKASIPGDMHGNLSLIPVRERNGMHQKAHPNTVTCLPIARFALL